MPLFRVKKDCEYRVMVPGTNVTRKLYAGGSIVELSSIEEGEQACRLESLSDQESRDHKDALKKEVDRLEKEAKDKAEADSAKQAEANAGNETSQGDAAQTPNGGTPGMQQTVQNAKDALRRK